MPAIPFFASLPSQPSTTPSTGPLAPPNTEQAPSTLADTMENAASSVMVPTEQQGETASDSSEQGLSFWQTLQQTTEMTDLPQGQTFAVLSEAADTLEVDIDELSSPELVTPVMSEGMIQSDIAESQHVIVNPLNVPKVDLTNLEVPQDEISMDFIESQRTAAPIYQVANKPSEPVMMLKGSGQILTPVEQPALQAQSMDVAKGSPVLNQTLNNHPLMEELSVMSEEVPEDLVEGLSLKSLGLDDKATNIHEKPLTLQKTEGEVKTQFSAVSESLQMVNTDGDESVVTSNLTSRTQTEMQSKPSMDAAANTEKPTTQFKVDVPPQSPQWSEQIAKRITIMSNEQIQSARIQLDPPELGLLEIKIKVQQDQVNVAFASSHQVVRDALENQAPRLKELMEQQGVDLTDVNVSDHGQQSMEGHGDEGIAGQGGADGEEGDWLESEDIEAQQTVTIQSDSLVDDFA